MGLLRGRVSGDVRRAVGSPLLPRTNHSTTTTSSSDDGPAIRDPQPTPLRTTDAQRKTHAPAAAHQKHNPSPPAATRNNPQTLPPSPNTIPTQQQQQQNTHPDSSSSSSVQVILRIRPSSYDINVPSRFQRTVITPINATTIAVESPPSTAAPAKSTQKFTFDRVFSPEEGQQQVWSAVEGLIHRFLEGYNVTVFAYGQTSSGKSYTMGTDRFTDELNHQHNDQQLLNSNRTGIIPRAVHTIFNNIQQQQQQQQQQSNNNNNNNNNNKTITIKTSYVEIYNEDLIDLIACASAPPGGASALPQVTIREDKDGNIIWSGLKEVKVSRAAEALELLEQGSQPQPHPEQTHNSTHKQQQQQQQQQQHSISKRASKIPPTQEGEWTTTSSKFHFVDLAGSERLKRTAAVAERVKEGISINAGLHALGNVISALGDPSKSKTATHIPYRDSKLTRLLQDSLGGNAQTLMVACVSPSEHNLGETLNTLKYANRARNIKNRAQVNAQEVGWEDVEYLQSTIIKLRKELAILKTSTSPPDFNRTLSSINEEDSVQDELSPKYLDLKGYFTELQAKYAKTLSDLAQAQNHLKLASRSSGVPQAISQSAFDEMIQPIVEEYEKSITALESQLALTKAALVHSEHSMKELEIQLANEQALNENQTNYVAELKARLNRLSERESENESYIKDLELKLKTLSENEESANGTVAELKKELAKIKEQDAESEAYIKDLEAKLSKTGSEDLTIQINSLEASVQDRDERYDALLAKYEALSSQLSGNNADLWEQQQHLTEQLSEREAKLEKLQAVLTQLENEKNEIESERQKLEATSEENTRTNNELRGRLKALESSATAKRSPSVTTDQGDARSIRSTHLSVGTVHNNNNNNNTNTISFTPPATPAATADLTAASTSDRADRELMTEFHELQERYEATASELDQVRAKYNNSVKELEDLTAQLEDSRVVQSSSSSSWLPRRSINSTTSHLRNSGSNYGSPTPSPILQSPSWPPAQQSSTSFSNHGILPVRGFGTPVTSGRTSSKYMEGKSIRATEGDSLEELADGGAQEPAERDPSSHRISIGTSQRQSHRISLNSGSLMPHGRSMSLSHDSSGLPVSTRGSMMRASSDSRSESGARLPNPAGAPSGDQLTPHGGERSYESLQKEVIKLQDVLKEREEEIRGLECSIRQVRSRSRSVDPPLLPTDEGDQKADLTEDSSDQDSPHPDKVLAAIQSQILLNDGDASVVKDSQNIKLLDNLMRSMAQKESAHLELIENLKDKLQSTKRQHDDLVKLSRDQVVNMSSEIESLRLKLSNPPTPDPEVGIRLSKLEELLKLKEEESEGLKAESKRHLLDLEAKLLEAKQSEIEALKAGHDSEVEQLKLEQRENLNRLIASSEEKLAAKQDELRRLEEQSQAALESQAEKIRAEFEEERKTLVASRSQAEEEALQEQSSRFDTETHQLLDQHAQAFETLQDELGETMKRAETKFEAQLQELKQAHASEVTRLTTTLSSRANQGNNTMEKLIRDHHEELDELRSSMGTQVEEERAKFETEKARLGAAHAEEIKMMEGRHEAQVAELKAEHEEILVASLTELDLRRTRKFESNLAALQDKHQAEIAEIKLEHQAQIRALSHESSGDTPPATDGDATVTARPADLGKMQSSYEEKIEMLKLQHQTDLTALEEKFLMSSLSADLREERQANQRKIDLLTDELDYLKEEVQKHKAAESQDATSRGEAAQSEAEVELQEALDTLSTLDKALLESQAERESLLKQLEEMKRTPTSEQPPPQTMMKELASMQAELDRTRQERDELLAQQQQQQQQQMASGGGSRPSHDGSYLNGRSGQGMGADSPSLPGLRTHLLPSGKPPPPTPPPSIPPPPPPTSSSASSSAAAPGPSGLPGLSGNSSNGTIRRPARTSNSSSQLSHTNQSNSFSGRESPSTSVATSCLVDAATVDPRVLKKVEEQESAIAKLSKQLSQCEMDLKANIDLVTNLESALNETERNLRKSRLQMNELAKERDKIATQNESLRKELAAATAEVEHVRTNVQAEKALFENQLGEERRAKENAKKQLEARMEEMQTSRMTRKSKFNCF
ncbi:hypothetical protein PTTG_01857 [Puccinia triticina 1-1 BBBD Race 1]|uniref:Kinesin motor domain-containing protein n=1 Tax=Puccinia triticina (isolate 1-1 / race 1 (BBBD)) TaxID=630390 RepID=A0A180G996_PUCT1|nr:hypothetical protein PTTG_01857 [Puccinia triticina 1-1 BBBD Race 1]